MGREDLEEDIAEYSSEFAPDSDLDEQYDWRQVSETRKHSYKLNFQAEQDENDMNGDSLMDLLDSMDIEPEIDAQEVKVPIISKAKSFDFKSTQPEGINPFIPTKTNKNRSSLLPESMMPELPNLPIRSSPYQKIIQDAANKQKQAQALFRSMSTSSPTSPVSPTLAIPKRGNSLLSPTDKSPFTDLAFKRPSSPQQRGKSPIYDEVTARKERLASLGIFDVAPRSNPTIQEPRRTSLKSFATPPHQKPVMLDKDIKKITGPQLISTSSKVQTVPISEILKDLKAAGRLVEEDEGEKRKKRNYFRRPS